MAGIPKVKIQFDADLDGLKKGTASADKEVAGFADKVGEFGKKAAAAFAIAAAAAAAYAVKLAVDGVKAAIEDEQAQLKLANALEAATGATNAQIKAVEDQILKTSLATGVADDKLRPALQRLAVATGDTEEAQKLLNLALDISAATGKPLETVSNALGKAYEGNTTALAKLNAGISTADAKTLGYTGAVQKLTDLYGGAAATNADTFQGRIDRVKVAFDETKESIGQALLPIVEKLLEFITGTVLPVFQKFSDALSGSGDGLLARFNAINDFIRDFVEPIIQTLRDAFTSLGETLKNKREDFEDILTTFKEIWAFIDKYLIPIIQVTLVAAIQESVKKIEFALNLIVPVLKVIFNSIKFQINSIIDLVNLTLRAYNAVAGILGNKQVALLQKVGEVTSGVSGGNTVSSSSLPSNFTAASNANLNEKVISSVSDKLNKAVSSAVANSAAKAVKELPKTLIEEVIEKNALKLIPPTVFDVAAVRRGEERSMMPPVPSMPTFDVAAARRGDERGNTYITVNGAMDSESTARQIVTLLNDSQARGTLGASGFAGLIAS